MNKEYMGPPEKERTDKPAPALKIGVAAAAKKKKSVLIINDNNDIYFEDDQSVPTFMSVFKNMGYKVTNEKAKDTLYSTWKKNYGIVVWSCGDDYSAVNDIKSRRMLVDYVTNGGRLILESGNIAAWCKEFGGETILNRDFREKVIQATIDWVYHDVGDLTLKNNHQIATTPNALPKTIAFTPTNPGDNSGDANAVRISSDATGIYNWSYAAYEGNLVKENIIDTSYGLIAYESKKNGGRIVYYAFDIDDIEDPDIQVKLIQNSEKWLRK